MIKVVGMTPSHFELTGSSTPQEVMDSQRAIIASAAEVMRPNVSASNVSISAVSTVVSSYSMLPSEPPAGTGTGTSPTRRTAGESCSSCSVLQVEAAMESFGMQMQPVAEALHARLKAAIVASEWLDYQRSAPVEEPATMLYHMVLAARQSSSPAGELTELLVYIAPDGSEYGSTAAPLAPPAPLAPVPPPCAMWFGEAMSEDACSDKTVLVIILICTAIALLILAIILHRWYNRRKQHKNEEIEKLEKYLEDVNDDEAEEKLNDWMADENLKDLQDLAHECASPSDVQLDVDPDAEETWEDPTNENLAAIKDDYERAKQALLEAQSALRLAKERGDPEEIAAAEEGVRLAEERLRWAREAVKGAAALDHAIAEGRDPRSIGKLGEEPDLLHLLTLPDDELTPEQRARVEAYKAQCNDDEAARQMLLERLKGYEEEMRGEIPLSLATGGVHIPTMGSLVAGVDGAVDAAGRSFKTLDEVKEEARREILSAQHLAQEAAGSAEDAQRELDTTTYWLGEVQDKVDREVREARKAAARLRRVRQKPKGSGRQAPWLKPSGVQGETLQVAVNPLTGGVEDRDPNAVTAFPTNDDDSGPPPPVRPAWTPERQVRESESLPPLPPALSPKHSRKVQE